ncbi:zinc finger domain-containing protein [Streptomyces celluloflavus]
MSARPVPGSATSGPGPRPPPPPPRQATFRKRQADSPADELNRKAWWAERTAVLEEIKTQGVKEALDWDCRACGAGIGTACHTAGGRVRAPHFLRATDAELPYHQAYGTR